MTEQKLTISLPFVFTSGDEYTPWALCSTLSSISDAPEQSSALQMVRVFDLGCTPDNDEEQPYNALMYSPLLLGRRLEPDNEDDQRYAFHSVLDFMQKDNPNALSFEQVRARWNGANHVFRLIDVKHEFDTWQAHRQHNTIDAKVTGSSSLSTPTRRM